MSNELIENPLTNEAVASLIIGGFINSCNTNFNKYNPIYLNADEPFSVYLKEEDIKGKDVLTVASSGDFLIYILNNKPNSVSTFDVNIFAKYYQDLKIGAILSLNYNEFLEFFYGNMAFNENSFYKILTVLPSDVKNFWKNLIETYDPKTILKSRLFFQTTYSAKKAISFNKYLSDEKNYLETRKNICLSTYAFHNLNYNNLNELKKKFDTIFLSNIVDDLSFYKSIRKIIASMQLCCNLHCNENGIVIASTINNPEIIESEFRNEYELRKFDERISSIKVKKIKEN